MNGISSELQKFREYFNGTAIVAFFRILVAAFGADWAVVFPNNLAWYSKHLKLSSLAILALKLVALSLEQNHQLPVVSE